jgi:hypothetical protein
VAVFTGAVVLHLHARTLHRREAMTVMQ